MKRTLAWRLSTSAILVSILAGGGTTSGQAPGPEAGSLARATVRGPEAPSYGPGFEFVNVTSAEFVPTHSSVAYDTQGRGLFSTTGVGTFVASPRLPKGALLRSVELDYCDMDPANDVQLAFVHCMWNGSNCVTLQIVDSGNGPGPGCSYLIQDLQSLNHTVDTYSRRYFLDVSTHSGTSNTRLLGVYVYYYLQVSPAPASATFLDVPTTHPFFRFIEALAISGITGGCTPPPSPNFCPDNPVTRGQMAVFLAAALGLHFGVD
jgi:hypothetical protein